MYPTALILLFPLSARNPSKAMFPQVLESSGNPPVPKPILESQLLQLFCSLAMTPILALECATEVITLNLSLLHSRCKEACVPISDFQVLRPNEVRRYFPSEINEYNELASFSTGINFCWWPIFIPRQILVKGIPQYVGNFVSSSSKPVCPPAELKV